MRQLKIVFMFCLLSGCVASGEAHIMWSLKRLGGAIRYDHVVIFGKGYPGARK